MTLGLDVNRLSSVVGVLRHFLKASVFWHFSETITHLLYQTCDVSNSNLSASIAMFWKSSAGFKFIFLCCFLLFIVLHRILDIFLIWSLHVSSYVHLCIWAFPLLFVFLRSCRSPVPSISHANFIFFCFILF